MVKNLIHNLLIREGNHSPLYLQITDALRQQIQSGKLKTGEKLTPSRNFALELGVSRTTITTAYEQLKAEGFIRGHLGSGFYVCQIGNIELTESIDNKQSEIEEFQPMRFSHPNTADMRLFPYRKWARCVSKVARLQPKALLDTSDIFGDIQLRKEIAHYLEKWRGLSVLPEQILITAGAVDALEICIRTLILNNDSIGLEDPGYLPLRRFIRSQKIKPVWLPVDKQGATLPRQGRKGKTPKLVVLTPSHQFPLGGAMPPKRRSEFLNWAEATNNWIIEDDYDSEFRYAGRPIPALSSLGDAPHAIYIGSFSNIFSSGFRLGFLVCPKVLIRQIGETVLFFGSKTSTSSQRALADFMHSGEFYRHLRRVRRIYAERQKLLVNLLKEELQHLVMFDNHQAGMQITVKLKSGLNDVEIVNIARQQGIIVDALSLNYSRSHKKSGLLLGFCGYNETEMIENISALKQIIKRQG